MKAINETKEQFERRLNSLTREKVLRELVEALKREPLTIKNPSGRKPGDLMVFRESRWSPTAEEFGKLSKEDLIAFYSECQYPANVN